MSTIEQDHLETRLRTLLRERADTVTGPPPGLPEAAPAEARVLPLLAPVALRRPWKAALAVAAAVVRTGKRGSDIVAATTPGVDLAELRLRDGHAVGRVETRSRTLPGPALVDVLQPGEAFPEFGEHPPPPTVRGYGSAARGDEAVDVDTGGNDAIASVRFTDGGAVRAIAELVLDAPDPVPVDLGEMTDEERRDLLTNPPQDPRCVAAEADLAPQLTHAFPGGDGSNPRQPASAALFTSSARTPTAAITAVASALGTSATDVTLTSPLSGGGVGGTWLDDAPVEAWLWQDGDHYRVTEVATEGACWSSGVGNLTPPGDPNPLTRLHLSRVPGILTGQLWYQMADGTAWTVQLDADDFARGNVAVEGESTEIDQVALLARDRDGRVVLAQKTSF